MLGGAALPPEPEQLSLPVAPTSGSWKLPPLKLLKRSKEQDLDRKVIEERGQGPRALPSPPTASRPTSSASPSGRP